MGLMTLPTVFLVGAGPGDPGLFTLKGVGCVREADVIIYDNLVNRKILDYAGPETELIFAGKKGSTHSLPQQEINALIIKKAEEKKNVVRLKGGDPFIFGRGGEEAEALASGGIPFEIVPGVTSAIAAPAYAGIPLTHRDISSQVTFITGNESIEKTGPPIDWHKVGGSPGTLVVFMGIKNLPLIAEKLIAHGKPPETPTAVIQWGTTPRQRTLTGPLGEIAGAVEKEGITPPGIVVVGESVKLHKKLNWFENRPLFGKKVLITREKSRAGGFAALIEQRGGIPVLFPAIQTVPPDSWDRLDRAIETIETYNWIIFTSGNGVRFFMDRLKSLGKDIRELKGIKICAVGKATAGEVASLGITVDLVPEKYVAESVIRGLKKYPISGERFLLPRAAGAREIIPKELTGMGATVDVVETYKTVRPTGHREPIRSLLTEESLDIITFTSASTVNNFMEMIGGEIKAIPGNVVIACIGPIVARTVEQAGLKPDIVPDTYTVESLVVAIEEFVKFPPLEKGN